jgi:uncharacterized protein YueI
MVSYSKKKIVLLDEAMLKNFHHSKNFSKDIKQSVVYDTHLNIDIQNFGFNIFSQYCEKNNTQFNVLNKFNQKRETKL